MYVVKLHMITVRHYVACLHPITVSQVSLKQSWEQTDQATLVCVRLDMQYCHTCGTDAYAGLCQVSISRMHRADGTPLPQGSITQQCKGTTQNVSDLGMSNSSMKQSDCTNRIPELVLLP